MNEEPHGPMWKSRMWVACGSSSRLITPMIWSLVAFSGPGKMRFMSGLSVSSGMLRAPAPSAGLFANGTTRREPLRVVGSASSMMRLIDSSENHSSPCRPERITKHGPGFAPLTACTQTLMSPPLSPTVTGSRITCFVPG